MSYSVGINKFPDQRNDAIYLIGRDSWGRSNLDNQFTQPAFPIPGNSRKEDDKHYAQKQVISW